MTAQLRRTLERGWYGGGGWLRLLLPLSGLFAAATALRRLAYRRGWLHSYRPPCCVVVVGNIVAGGTGKTPVVIALARALAARGYRIAIAAGGYRGRERARPQRVHGDSDPRAVGDEAVLLAMRAAVPVAAGARRAAAVRLLLEDPAPPEIVICDDGLQHYALQRDMEIVTIDAARRFGNGRLLPAGPLREAPSRLAAADRVLERGGSDPRSAVSYRLCALRCLATGEERPPARHGLPRQVYALAGIADPAPFFAALRGLGFETRERRFADHHAFRAADLAPLDDRPVIMTEKDAVKCRPFARRGHWVLVVAAQLPDGLVDAVERRAKRSESR